MNRKFKKLLRNPKLFFSDMYAKRSLQLKKVAPTIYQGKYQYTVIAAVFNVELYLDDFFTSMVNQSLLFENHIHLIMVDDGSNDKSAEIIHRWQKKYPKNIHYHYKTNGGQSTARNLGIECVQTQWITFIDPDDYIHPDYFKIIDQTLASDNKLVAAVGNLKFYYENQKMVKDTHPLRYRFEKKLTKLPCHDLNNHINLSVSTTFFRNSEIESGGIRFDARVKPNFEDGKFIADYFLHTTGTVAFVKDAVYFYRKREDGTSTLDTAWQRFEKFYDVLVYGKLAMLEQYQNQLGYIPKHVQRTVLYDMSWYVKYLLDAPEKLNFLNSEQKSRFLKLCDVLFTFIDASTILEFNLAGIWFMHKVGMLGAFKHEAPAFQIGYIENIDREQKQICLRYFTYFEQNTESFQINGVDITPNYRKVVRHNFGEELFVYEVRAWLAYGDIDSKLALYIDGKQARLTLKGKQYKTAIALKEIIQGFRPSTKYVTDGSWLLMDRDTQADDNAEHLYRYIRRHYPEQVCYFALNRDSADWARLTAEGFNLLAFGTKPFERQLRKASKIISSHLDRYINNYFGDEYEYSKKFIFLQHGVTHNNLSQWFNSKKNLQCVVTTTQPEYDSLVHGGEYALTEKEVVLTGFPRHDALIANNTHDQKIILVMPTWRKSLVADTIGLGNKRGFNHDFMNTRYARHWHSFLHSAQLRQLTEEFGYQIIFAPHANIVPYLDVFDLPDYIEPWQVSNSEEGMQALFQKAQFMITDFSSVAFDIAILNKTVLYYHFDYDEIFSGGHITQQGYFSYIKHGFGPVAYTEEELLGHLTQTLQNGGAVSEPYTSRINNTFPYRDGGCCERVYQAILNLDVPKTDDANFDALNHAYINAKANRAWNLLETRSKVLMCLFDEGKLNVRAQCDAGYRVMLENDLLASLIAQNKLTQAFDYLRQVPAKIYSYWEYRLAWALGNDEFCYDYLKGNSPQDADDWVIYAYCCAKLGHIEAYSDAKTTLISFELKPNQSTLLGMAEYFIKRDYDAALNHLDAIIADDLSHTVQDIKIELIGYQLCMRMGDLAKAHSYLAAYEKHTKNDPQCELAIAHLAFSLNNYGKCINKYKPILISFEHLIQKQYHEDYLNALIAIDKWDELANYMAKTSFRTEFDLSYYKVKHLFTEKKWREVIDVFENSSPLIQHDLNFEYVTALLRLAKWDDAKRKHRKPDGDDSYAYWSLINYLGQITNDLELQERCLLGKVSVYPEIELEKNLAKLELLRANKN